MRLLFIPGFGEDPWIFHKMQQDLPGEKIFIDNWKLLYNVAEKDLTVTDYSGYLIQKFQINKEDVVIGHSMGGWIALQIKHLTGCKAIQISSWTTGSKVVTVPLPRHDMYLVAKQGSVFNDISLKVLVTLFYLNKPSKEVFKAIFRRIQYGDKEIIVKQLMIIYNHPNPPIAAFPDLRIHAKKDHIIRPPDEPFVEVPGDHFSLYTYPADVARPIVEFLNNHSRNV